MLTKVIIVVAILVGLLIVALTFDPQDEYEMRRLDDDWDLAKSRGKKLK